MTTLLVWGILIFLSFLPPLLYTLWIRNTERYHREQWKPILLCFLWGATIAVVAAFILEVLLEIPLTSSLSDGDMVPFLAVVLIAPVVEEFTKPLALRLRSVQNNLDELEDGLIYGAAAGLGFSATENLLYGYSFLSEGVFIFIIFMGIRSFSGCLLHAAATALTGYGYGRTIMKHSSLLSVLPYFFLAIFLHGFYNFLLSSELIGAVSGFILALLVVVLAIIIVRKKIKTLDEKNC